MRGYQIHRVPTDSRGEGEGEVMAGRSRYSQNPLHRQEVPLQVVRPVLIEDPRLAQRIPPSVAIASSHPSLAEDAVAARRREIQSLIVENQRLAATHLALKQEVAAAQQELRRVSAVADNVKAERDAEVRGVYDRSRNMEAEVRSIDALSAQLAHARMDVQKLTAAKQELTAELKSIDGNLARARAEAEELPEIKAEIETMRRELQRGRAAIEYEKRTHAVNLEQSQAMEKNMFSMTRELERLHAELANAEKRARAAAAAAANPSPVYGASYGNGNLGYGGHPYSNLYGMHQAQTQDVVDGGPYGPSESQQMHVQR